MHTLGEDARRHYRIIIDDAAEVARQMEKAMPLVKENRRDTGDAYGYELVHPGDLHSDLQIPFEPSHENMANLKLYPDQPVEVLAADLRRAFSGIVAGNVKEVGIRAIEEFGPYKIHGDPEMMRRMDDMLQGFVAQHRMKLPGSALYSVLRNHQVKRHSSPLKPDRHPAFLFVLQFIAIFNVINKSDACANDYLVFETVK